MGEAVFCRNCVTDSMDQDKTFSWVAVASLLSESTLVRRVLQNLSAGWLVLHKLMYSLYSSDIFHPLFRISQDSSGSFASVAVSEGNYLPGEDTTITAWPWPISNSDSDEVLEVTLPSWKSSIVLVVRGAISTSCYAVGACRCIMHAVRATAHDISSFGIDGAPTRRMQTTVVKTMWPSCVRFTSLAFVLGRVFDFFLGRLGINC